MREASKMEIMVEKLWKIDWRRESKRSERTRGRTIIKRHEKESRGISQRDIAVDRTMQLQKNEEEGKHEIRRMINLLNKHWEEKKGQRYKKKERIS